MRSLKYLLFAFVICLITLSKANAEVCTYVNGQLTLRCNVNNNTLSCGFIGNTRVNYASVEDNGATVMRMTYQEFSQNIDLKASDFVNRNGEIDCNEVRIIYTDYNVISAPTTYEIYDIRDDNNCQWYSLVRENNNETVYSTAGDASGCQSFSLSNSNDNEGGFGNSTEGSFGGESQEGGFGGEFQEGSQEGVTEEVEDIVSNFCSESRLGVFTTIGWVFFFAKILIPIVLIIFGCIDFGKAVISNKDDEVKKAAKSLVMRAIAGIIIFFVPSVINLVVGLIDDENNIYNGSFKNCTQCMLDPTHEFDDGTVCRRLIGD